LIPDLRPWDEHDEVLDPRESIALAPNILDLGFVDLPFLDRHVRRSEARPRIRHSPLHAATPRRRPVSHRGVRYITIQGSRTETPAVRNISRSASKFFSTSEGVENRRRGSRHT